MKRLVILGVGIFTILACGKDEPLGLNCYSENIECQVFCEQPHWDRDSVLEFDIQYPNNFKGGIQWQTDSYTYSKYNKDCTIVFSHYEVWPIFRPRYWDTIPIPIPEHVLLPSMEFGDTLVLTNRVKYCFNEPMDCIFYYDDKPKSHGIVYFKEDGGYTDRMWIRFNQEKLPIVRNILATIRLDN